MYLLILTAEIIILYFFSRSLTKNLSYILHRFLKHKKLTVYILAILFLPGTIIHEFSHQLMAELLFVRTGRIHLIPEIVGNDIKMGHAEIQITDPIRRFFIGIAPFIFGIFILLSSIYLSMKYFSSENLWIIIILLYVVFQIGNTMFASKKDMEGAFALIFITSIIISALYLLGIRISINEFAQIPVIIKLFRTACLYLSIPLILDFIFLLIFKFIKR